MEVGMSLLAGGLLGAAGVAFARRQKALLVLFGALFVPVAAAASLQVWWPLSPALAVALPAVTLGLSVVGVALFAADLVWAPFCLEMTYPALTVWVLWPLLAAANLAGLAVRAAVG